MNQNSWFQRILLPGLLFQSVMIGGGYSTGRELVEFFLGLGPIGGFLALLAACVGFSVVAVFSFELARITLSFDYRNFFKNLIGPGWIIYELAYFALGLLVLAVIGAAAGEVVAEHLGFSRIVGTIALVGFICVLVLYGTALIERVLTIWSLILYTVYLTLVILYISRFDVSIDFSLPDRQLVLDSVTNGVKYLGYNIASLPVILFCIKHMQSRSDAVTAGLLVGPLAIIPAGLFLLMLFAAGPDVLHSALPADDLLQRLGYPVLTIVFYVVVFGTLVETGAAYIHAVNERIAIAWGESGKTLPNWVRPCIAAIVLILSVVLAQKIGLIGLIADGYGTLTWIFLAVFVLPLLTVAQKRIWGNRRADAP